MDSGLAASRRPGMTADGSSVGNRRLEWRRAGKIFDPARVLATPRPVPDDHVRIDLALQTPGKRGDLGRAGEGARRFLPDLVPEDHGVVVGVHLGAAA